MGYKRNRTVDLKFGPDTGEMAGFEISLRRLSVEETLDISELADIPDDTPIHEQKKLVRELTDRVAEKIVSWNLDDDNDQPIPPSGTALRAEDLAFVQEIVTAWLDAIGSVSAPLAQTSSAGVPSEVSSIPMDALSPSPPS